MLAAVAALAALRPAFAQSGFPSRTVRIVVPFAPGGTTDHVSRLIATELAKLWGEGVVVENKPGGGTIIGVDTVAKAPADGYSLVTVTGSFAVNPSLMPKLPYDTAKDLRPVAMLAKSDHVLVVHPSVAAAGLREFVALAKANPGKFAYASFGNGTSAHLAGEALNLQAGLDLVHVPYKGQAPALADVMGGQVQAVFANLPEVLPQIRSGRVKALGLAAKERSAMAPDIPTLAEQGYAGLESSSWSGLLAPAGTPDAVVEKINHDVNAILATAETRKAVEDGGITPQPATPEAFGRFLRAEIDRYAVVIRKVGITKD
ncbi:MAG TPA: tripartite tricarboxylate transporter substrate binding protein [Burkholderiaceae bacterium]|nr:tripartite tricarboxylate transporter substrate binding protein [Burkholderiaceae bacterium]